MKIHAAETVTVIMDGITMQVNVEDASKGDIILGNVQSVSAESGTYIVGKSYEFPRESIQNTNNN